MRKPLREPVCTLTDGPDPPPLRTALHVLGQHSGLPHQQRSLHRRQGRGEIQSYARENPTLVRLLYWNVCLASVIASFFVKLLLQSPVF